MSSRKPDSIRRIDDIYDEELWQAHELNRSRLIRTCRQQLEVQCTKRNAPPVGDRGCENRPSIPMC